LKTSRKQIQCIALLACAHIITCASQTVRADFVQLQSQTVGPTGVNYASPVLVSIPQFNPATGTLLFVLVRITANFDAMVQAENLAQGPANITVLATETVSVTPPVFVSPVPAQGTASIPLSNAPVAPFDGTADFLGPDTATFTLTPNPQSQLIAGLTFNSGLSNFIGVGNLPAFSVNGTGSFFVASDNGSLHTQTSLKAGATIEVEYHYIPEPSTLALLGLAFGSVVFRHRRRR
jgi:hypothetical protein